ncbi:MAG: TlpA family protein disulfide reductase [Reichenbachiella sp.]
MKKISIAALIMVMTLVSSAFAQKKAIPPYMIGNAFPDSVRDFSIQSMDGNMVKFGDVLDQYKGQKIVVDMWATWCKDCIVSLPDLNKLMDADAQVAYVMISVDKDEMKWKSGIRKFDIRGDHYRSVKGWESTLSNYIVLDWVPRYFVLDEEGKVIEPKIVKANSPALYGALSIVN